MGLQESVAFDRGKLEERGGDLTHVDLMRTSKVALGRIGRRSVMAEGN